MSIVQPIPKPPEYLEPFLSYCHRRRYPNKTDIIRPGDPADALYYLIDGSVSTMYEDDDGREIVLAYVNKGEFIGEMGFFMSEPTRSVLVRTRSEVHLAEISYSRFDQLLDNELRDHAKALLLALGAQITGRLVKTSEKVGHLAFWDVTGRIAGTLLNLCKEPDALTHPDGMQISITRQEIGRIVGCSREMAGRVLKNLEEQGLIRVKGKTIVVFGTR